MNMDVISEITLDVAGKVNRYTTVRAKQGDNLTRKIHAAITNSGVNYFVESNSIVLINFRRYDELTKSFEGTVEEDGTVILPLPYWALELPYTVTCDVTIIENSGEENTRKLTTFNFYIDVEAASVSDSDIQADDATPYLLQLIGTIQELVEFKESKGATNGLASLDNQGKVPFSQLPGEISTGINIRRLSL